MSAYRDRRRGRVRRTLDAIKDAFLALVRIALSVLDETL